MRDNVGTLLRLLLVVVGEREEGTAKIVVGFYAARLEVQQAVTFRKRRTEAGS